MKKSLLPLGLIVLFTVIMIGVLLLVASHSQEKNEKLTKNENVNLENNDEFVYLQDNFDIYRYNLNGKLETVYEPNIAEGEYIFYQNIIGDYFYVKINMAGVEERLVKVSLLTGEKKVLYKSDLKFSFVPTENGDIFISTEDNELFKLDKDGNKKVIVSDLSIFDLKKSELEIPGSRINFLGDELINNRYFIFGGYDYEESALIDVTKQENEALTKKLPSLYFYRPITVSNSSNEILYALYSYELEKEQIFYQNLDSNQVEIIASYDDGGLGYISYNDNKILVGISDFVDSDGNQYPAGQYLFDLRNNKFEKFEAACEIYDSYKGPSYEFNEGRSRVAWINYDENKNEVLVVADYNDTNCLSSLKKYDLPQAENQWYLFDF